MWFRQISLLINHNEKFVTISYNSVTNHYIENNKQNFQEKSDSKFHKKVAFFVKS